MFRRLSYTLPKLSWQFEGLTLTAQQGESVALALLAAGFDTCRESVVSGQPRGPYCLMGACFECLMVINGVQNCQGCQVEVQEGMTVTRQHRGRTVAEVVST